MHEILIQGQKYIDVVSTLSLVVAKSSHILKKTFEYVTCLLSPGVKGLRSDICLGPCQLM